jgi:hypothetical protein
MPQKPRQREWYIANREYHLARTNARHERARGAIRQLIAAYSGSSAISAMTITGAGDGKRQRKTRPNTCERRGDRH